ncbi:hypothetical protein E2C01_069410 [Portunus trituberculatus]|uniref:Uncharacterized protein n=1 Tax=Portunus trituberculatus TaxID=210409 RepID=A0A5B7I0Q5_PORTR|nr:hypothetical protein [Portunus trituberculatus]
MCCVALLFGIYLRTICRYRLFNVYAKKTLLSPISYLHILNHIFPCYLYRISHLILSYFHRVLQHTVISLSLLSLLHLSTFPIVSYNILSYIFSYLYCISQLTLISFRFISIASSFSHLLKRKLLLSIHIKELTVPLECCFHLCFITGAPHCMLLWASCKGVAGGVALPVGPDADVLPHAPPTCTPPRQMAAIVTTKATLYHLPPLLHPPLPPSSPVLLPDIYSFTSQLMLESFLPPLPPFTRSFSLFFSLYSFLSFFFSTSLVLLPNIFSFTSLLRLVSFLPPLSTSFSPYTPFSQFSPPLPSLYSSFSTLSTASPSSTPLVTYPSTSS